MNSIQKIEAFDVIALDLDMDENEVESYFKNYYINRFFPIRDLVPIEMALVKFYEESKYMSANEVLTLCSQHQIPYNDYLLDRWILPKAMVKMEDAHYALIKKYAKIILEPYVNYKNYRGPRYKLVSKEEIAMLLSGIATGTSIIPGDTVTIRTSMEAMDRLRDIYDEIEKNNPKGAKAREELREMSPVQLIELIGLVKGKKGAPDRVRVTTKKITSPKKPRKKQLKGDNTDAIKQENLRL